MTRSNAAFSFATIVSSGKGGVGKILLAQLIADLSELNNIPLDVAQIDDQNRLAKSLGREVVSIDIALLKKPGRTRTP